MPSSGVEPGSRDNAISALKRQVDRVGRRLISLADITQSGAADGDVPVWNATSGHWEPGAGGAVIPVLHGDPATLVEGLIWFDLDATC